jgi:hypothetical protein
MPFFVGVSNAAFTDWNKKLIDVYRRIWTMNADNILPRLSPREKSNATIGSIIQFWRLSRFERIIWMIDREIGSRMFGMTECRIS